MIIVVIDIIILMLISKTDNDVENTERINKH